MIGAVSQRDVVIAGAGIAGSALAIALARAGLSVLVLEKETEYRDKVRGEWLAPWGVQELKRLGLYDLLRAHGAHHLTRHRGYQDELDAEANPLNAIDLRALAPDSGGPLCLGHPAMCRILSQAAEQAGATLLRGVTGTALGLAEPAGRSARYEHDGAAHTVQCRLVVGADGRGSLVRKQAGIELHRDPTHHLFAGLLVEGAHDWPDDLQATGVEDDRHFLVFPQGNGRARLYLGYALEQHKRLTGPDAAQHFLEAFRLRCLPAARSLADAQPAGPCHSYGNEDTWTDDPAADGVVLIGDAAGHNDPIIGQGLSISLRDVRIVRDILLASDDWSHAAFAPYRDERRERMRRLRFTAALDSSLMNEFGPKAEARRVRARARQTSDPSLALWFLAALVGPDALPPQAFEDRVREQLLAE
jgi:2-polyprenyl-6-methoxyphenol hydroxylase-like FAD-dependent oxidoreductase